MKTTNILAALVLALLTSLNSYAIDYEIIGPCSIKPLYTGTFNQNDLSVNVGKTSVIIFEQQNIPYIGTESAFNSIANTPTGIDSIEVISDTQMRAYGWCYSVNGINPDVLPGDYLFTAQNDKLVWFYAYSTYDNGKWLDYCVPSYKVQADQFCKK